MKTTMLTTLLILLAISTITLADDYRTGTCGKSTTLTEEGTSFGAGVAYEF